MKKPQFKVGDCGGVMEILEVIPPQNMEILSSFRVRYCCCGKEAIVGYQAVLMHFRRESTGCRTCFNATLSEWRKPRTDKKANRDVVNSFLSGAWR